LSRYIPVDGKCPDRLAHYDKDHRQLKNNNTLRTKIITSIEHVGAFKRGELDCSQVKTEDDHGGLCMRRRGEDETEGGGGGGGIRRGTWGNRLAKVV
jgi:hypothetical protein